MLNKKKVLGRGLNALIGEASKPLSSKERYFLCPIEQIAPNLRQPRKTFNDVSLKELADSIKEKGVIEPLIVRKNTMGGFELIAGERRLRASKMAGVKEVPVVIVDATDEESLEFAIIENIQREDLNAVEEAEAYKSLMSFGLSQEEVAKRVGKERATVTNYLRLLRLPLDIRDELQKGAITMGHARAILSVEGHGPQGELCRKIISRGLSVREAEALVARGAKRQASRPIKKHPSTSLEDELRTLFGTRITVADRNGKGKIEIAYFSAEERERVIDLLRSVRT